MARVLARLGPSGCPDSPALVAVLMGVLVVIQARLGSTRYPAKVLEMIGDFPVLFHVLMRAKHALPFAKVIIAAPGDDVQRMRENCVGDYFGWDGPENDVLGRFFAATRLSRATTIVRLTADCPFVDPAGIRAVADAVVAGEADYAWTGDQVNGLDAEAFIPALLDRANRYASASADREHVTPWLRRHATRAYRFDGFDHLPRYRWTLDTKDDLAWAREVARLTDTSPPDPSADKLHALIQAHPELRRMETMDDAA